MVNVGVGAGSYEPAGRRVLGIEPSLEMIRQRAPGAAPAVRASAGELPPRDRSMDAALAVLTVHHFPELVVIDRRIFPTLADFQAALGEVDLLRLAISTFSKIDAAPGLARLRDDLDSGAWHRRHGGLVADQDLDLGYRLVVRKA